MRLSWVRSASGLIVLAMVLVACGSTDDEEAPPSVASATAETSTSIPADRVAAIEACRQLITSAGVMVRDYNAFMKRLNAVQDYSAIGDEDRWAAETLDTGASLIRERLVDGVPDDLAQQIEDFLTSTELLSEQITKKQMTILNRTSATWGARRTAALDRCEEYLPVAG